MHVSVKAKKVGIVVMKDAESLDRAATDQIRKKQYIEAGKIRNSLTFRPILMVEYTWARPIPGVVAIVKTEIEKDGQFLWEHTQPQHGQIEIFYPNGNLFQLQQFLRRNDPVGLWRLTASIALMPGITFEAIPASGINSHLFSRVRYTQIATLVWRVVLKLSDQVDIYGNLLQPIRDARRLQEIEVSLDEI